jgi:glycosyltransferase involved in cell wall biosynthesis
MRKREMSRPKIAIDCRYLGPRPSGIGECVAALVRHLPDLAQDCDFLFLRHPRRTTALSDAANVTEVTVRAAANGPVTLAHLPLVVDLAGVDLFHAPANILPGGLTMPAITTVHDVMWLTHPQWCNPAAWGRVERAFYRYGITRALARSARVATVSEASRDAIRSVDPAAADRTHVTFSGVAEDFAPVSRDETVLGRLGLPPGQRFVLVVGQGAPYKNHAGALRAFAAAFGQGGGQCGEIDLVLVRRRGDTGPALEQLARSLGIAGRVRFLEAVERPALVQLYSAAAVLLHPSLAEGFGNPLAEAMACGCPVVTSDRSAMPEVTGGAALLADPDDPRAIAAMLRRVVEDRAVAADLRKRGLRRAAMLDWRNFAAANLALYRQVLAETG